MGKSAAVDVLLRQGGVDVNLTFEDFRILSYAALHLHVSKFQIVAKYGARMENERDCRIVSATYANRELG